MSRKFKFGVLVLALSMMLTAVPVMAAPPLDVHIEAPSTIDPADVDSFVAIGPAVDAGAVCPSGDVIDLSGAVSGPPEGTFRILKITKHFLCDDGSGTFDIKLVVRLNLAAGETSGSWTVVSGTGAYAGLHGNGKLVGFPIVPGESVLDIYDGKMH